MQLLFPALLAAFCLACALPAAALDPARPLEGLHPSAAPTFSATGASAPGAPLSPLRPRVVNAIKAALACAATGLLLLDLWLARRGRAAVARRTRGACLALLGALGAICWWNLLQFNFPRFSHASDTFHAYLGAKYFPELGYTHLYACTAVADWEAGLRGSRVERPMRHLATNRLETTAEILAQPSRCTSRFTAARWAAFAADVSWMRRQVTPRRWNRFQQDHGYNATPMWTLLARTLAQTGPASDVQIAWLRLLDPALLLVMWGIVCWAFGWRIACVAAVYWGTNYAAPFGWTGGAILRQAWLASSVVGVCLLRRRHPLAGGFLLTLAALLRIFPALLIAGVGLGAVGRMVRQRRIRLTRAQRRFAAGCLVALATLVPLSGMAGGGLETWVEFARNSRLHLDTPLTNQVGLKTVLSYDHANRAEHTRDLSLADPMERWKEARRETFADRRALFWALVLGFAALVARAASTHEDWVAAVLGVALVPIAAELTAYYWAVLFALAFAMQVRAPMGAALCGLAALGWWVGDALHWTDQIHVWISTLTVTFCVFTVLLLTDRPPRAAARA